MAAASDISWSGPDGTFNLRVAAVIRRDEEILLCTVDGLDYWFLPGLEGRFTQEVNLRVPSSKAVRGACG